MIMKMLLHVEDFAFDLGMMIAVPLLIWWVNYGLQREDLSDELREFWAQ